MFHAKLFNIPVLVSAGVLIAVQLLLPSMASAQTTVTMDADMLTRCDSEGLAAETCACWFAAIAEAEGQTEFSEEDIDALAPNYQDELGACMDANQDADQEEGE